MKLTQPTFPATFEDAVREAQTFNSYIIDVQRHHDTTLAKLVNCETREDQEGYNAADILQLVQTLQADSIALDYIKEQARNTDNHAKRLLDNSGILYRWFPDAHALLSAQIAEENRKRGFAA